MPRSTRRQSGNLRPVSSAIEADVLSLFSALDSLPTGKTDGDAVAWPDERWELAEPEDILISDYTLDPLPPRGKRGAR